MSLFHGLLHCDSVLADRFGTWSIVASRPSFCSSSPCLATVALDNGQPDSDGMMCSLVFAIELPPLRC